MVEQDKDMGRNREHNTNKRACLDCREVVGDGRNRGRTTAEAFLAPRRRSRGVDDVDDGGKVRWRLIRDIEEVVDVGVLLAALAAAGLDGEHAGNEHMLLHSLREGGRQGRCPWVAAEMGKKGGSGNPRDAARAL